MNLCLGHCKCIIIVIFSCSGCFFVSLCTLLYYILGHSILGYVCIISSAFNITIKTKAYLSASRPLIKPSYLPFATSFSYSWICSSVKVTLSSSSLSVLASYSEPSSSLSSLSSKETKSLQWICDLKTLYFDNSVLHAQFICRIMYC